MTPARVHGRMTTPPTDMLTIPVSALACPGWCVECQDTTPLGDTDIGGHSSCKAFGEVRLTRHDRMDLAPDGTIRLNRGDVVVFLPGDEDREFTVAEAARLLVDLGEALEAITADAER